MNGLIFDIKVLLRSLLKSPNYVIPIIVMLAIGIGSATAIISAIDIVIFRETFINYNRFAMLGWDSGNGFVSTSYPIQVIPYIENGESFEFVSLYTRGRGVINTKSESFGAEYCSVNFDFFSAFDGKPILGRL